MKHFISLLIALCAVWPAARAQSEMPGGIPDGGVQGGGGKPAAPELVQPVPELPGGSLEGMSLFAPGVKPDWSRPLSVQPFVFASNVNTVNAFGVAPLFMWNGGGVIASGSRESIPGLMGIEQGSIGIGHTLGRVTFTASASAEKYGYFRGLQTVYGVSGTALWRISGNLSLTVFGSYYTRANFTGPAMMPYMSTSAVGGYITWDFAEHWGVDAGVQSQYNNYTGRWDTRPIVRPYYKFDNGAKIGVDVGGLIYDAVDSHRSRHSNPTMGPPVPKGPPPVRMDRR